MCKSIKDLIGINPETIKEVGIKESSQMTKYPSYNRNVTHFKLTNELLGIFKSVELVEIDDTLIEVKLSSDKGSNTTYISILDLLANSLGTDINGSLSFSVEDQKALEKKLPVSRYWCFSKSHISLFQEEFADDGYGISLMFKEHFCELIFINTHNFHQ